MSDSLKFQHFELLTKSNGSPHELGQGAMGTTYKAVDTNLQSTVVIKVINPQYVSDPVVKRRFLQEAKTMAKVRHTNVASIFHLGECPNGVFFAMEFCDGPTLQEYVEANGAMSIGDSLLICQQVSSALQAAHERQLVHRDLKPSNLILVQDDRKQTSVKVIDFGLARAFGDDVTQLDLTGGGFVGTPNYASPEQLKGNQDLDTRADIYSLGVTLWFMLCGSPTFNGTQFEVMGRHVNEEPPWEVLPELPDSALAIIHRMLQKSPDERYQSPMELWEDIQKCLVEEGVTDTTGSTQGSILETEKFETIEEIGSGHTGKVFSGKDSIVGGRIAIKVVNSEILEAPGAIRDIRRQIRHLNSIKQHPNILKIVAFDDSDDDRDARLIMEWVQGTTLEKVLSARPNMALHEALPILSQIAQGIDFALENKLPFLELAPHQILVQLSSDSRGRIDESRIMSQPVDKWPDCIVKLNALRVVPPDEPPETFDLDEAPTIISSGDVASDDTVPSIYNFCSIVYRLLGGTDSNGEKPLDVLSDRGNEVLDLGRVARGSSPAGKSCAELLTKLCRCERIAVPDGLGERKQSSTFSGSSRSKGSTFEQQKNEIELKLRRLELERIAAEQEGALLGREEEVEQQRLIVEDERERLEQEKAALEQQMEEERQAVEEGKQLLSKERSKLRKEMEAQEAALAAEKQQQAIEFQRFVEEREQWQQEQKAADEKRAREQREAQERISLEEGRIGKEVEERRKALEKAAEELEARRARLEEELRRKTEEQSAGIQSERLRIEEAQKNLEARLSRQTLDLDEAQRQVESARKELRTRMDELEQESIERAATMEAAMAQQTEELESARKKLSAERKALQEDRESQEAELQQRWQQEKTRLDNIATEIEARQTSLNRAENEAVARDEDQQSLARQKAMRQEQLLLLEEDRKALDAERVRLQQQQRREDELRTKKEIEDRERIAVREQELDGLKNRLEEEAAERLQAHQKAKVEFEALLAKERDELAEERKRIEAAKQEGGVQAQVLERERAELKNLRTELAELASNLDRRESEERTRLEQEKEQELEWIENRETELTDRQAELEEEESEIQARIDAEKRRLVELEESRKSEEQRFKEEEGQYAERAARFAVVESNAERKLTELRKKIAALEIEETKSKQRHRVRLRIIAASLVVLLAAGVFAAIKGKAYFIELLEPGTNLTLAHTELAAEHSTAESWLPLLEQVVTTDQSLRNEPKYSNKREEFMPKLLDDADQAVSGLLKDLAEEQSLSDEEAIKLSSALSRVIAWNPVANKKLLFAKLHLGIAARNEGVTAAEALRRYVDAYGEDRELASDLRSELEVLVETLSSIFGEKRALTESAKLIEALEALPESATVHSPDIKLLLTQLKADKARESQDFAGALDLINKIAESDPDERWMKTLGRELDLILDDLAESSGVDILQLETKLSRSGELFENSRPYMILAENSPRHSGTQFTFYSKAARHKSVEGRAWAAFLLAISSAVDPLMRFSRGVSVVGGIAEQGNSVGQILMARLRLGYSPIVGRDQPLDWDEGKTFKGKKKNLEEALRLTRLAKRQGHNEAPLYEATALLSLGILNESTEEVTVARNLLLDVIKPKERQEVHNPTEAYNQTEAYWQIYRSYMTEWDRNTANASERNELAARALTDGSRFGNFDCVWTIAEWFEKGQSPLVQSLPNARRNHLSLVMVDNEYTGWSKQWLRKYATRKDLDQADRQWIEQNQHHWK